MDSVQTGDVQLQANAAARSSIHVAFQKTYSKAPTVVVQNTSLSTAWQYGLITHGVTNVTASGFDVYVWNGNASNTLSPSFKWVAFIDWYSVSSRILFKQVTVTIPTTSSTSVVTTQISRTKMLGITIKKNDDFFYNPIMLSVYDDGSIEALTISRTAPSTARTYVLNVAYLNI